MNKIMRKRFGNHFIGLVFLLSVLALHGCSVGPKYARPGTMIDEANWSLLSHYFDTNDANSSVRWWERFDDDVTNELVVEALRKNYDVAAASAKLLQAEAELKIAGGKLMPGFDADFGRKLLRRSSGPPGSSTEDTAVVNKTRTYTAGLSISYVLDIFGKLQHGRDAELADLLETRAFKQGVVNSLIAAVVNSRVEISTLLKRLEIARANTESLSQTLDIVERRYSQGLVGPVDVRLARANYASAKAAEPEIELALIKAANALDELVVRPIGSSINSVGKLKDLPDLAPVGVGMPSSLLERRPDVIAAEAKLRAQNERIGVSVANLFPDLTFSGSMGWSSNKSNMVFVDEAWIYSYLLNLAQPVFKGGQLSGQVEWEKARYQEFAADYAKTAFTALREVEDEMVNQQFLQEKLEHVEVQFAEASFAEELSIDRYNRGVETILSVLESERRRRSAENSLAVLKGRIWSGRVGLFLALGGDWIKE